MAQSRDNTFALILQTSVQGNVSLVYKNNVQQSFYCYTPGEKTGTFHRVY